MRDNSFASLRFCLPRSLASARPGVVLSLADLKRLFAPVLVEMDQKPLLVGRMEPREAAKPMEAKESV